MVRSSGQCVSPPAVGVPLKDLVSGASLVLVQGVLCASGVPLTGTHVE